MTNFQVKTNSGHDEVVTAESYEIFEGWIHFRGESDAVLQQVASYPEATITSIRRQVEADTAAAPFLMALALEEAAGDLERDAGGSNYPCEEAECIAQHQTARWLRSRAIAVRSGA